MTDLQWTPNGPIVNGSPPSYKYPGSCSETYQCDDVVLKLDIPNVDYPQATLEAERWENLDDDERQYFTEVLDYGTLPDGRGWIIKRYHNIIEGWGECEEFEDAFYETIDPLIRKYRMHDVDINYNTGWDLDNEQWIIYDWGWAWN